jgi:amidase
MRRDGVESSPDCIEAVEATAKLLEELGHSVAPTAIEALDAPIDHAFGIIMTVAVAADVARWSARLGRDITSELESTNAFLAETGKQVKGTDYVGALDDISSWSRAVSRWWDDHDILVLPTSPEPPVPLGVLSPAGQDVAAMTRMSALVTFTSPFDLTGQPAISLPLHWNADGLPIGVQLVAAYGREDVLLQIAAQLEVARPWAGRRPPVHA